MKNSKLTPLFIAMELLITIGLLVQGNYLGATGWGFLMLTNINKLIEDKENGNTKQ